MIPKRLLPDVRLTNKNHDDPLPEIKDEDYYEWQYMVDTRKNHEYEVGFDIISKFVPGNYSSVPVEATADQPLYVDWGDGTQEWITSNTNDVPEGDSLETKYSTRGLIHQYADGGKYIITVGCSYWRYKSLVCGIDFPSSRDPSLYTFGSSYYKALFQATLIKILKPLPPISGSRGGYTYTNMRYGVSAGITPEDVIPMGEPNYRKVVYREGWQLKNTFSRCIRLRSVPENLFEIWAQRQFVTDEEYEQTGTNNSVRALAGIPGFFRECISLKTIPKRLFSNLPHVQDFSYVFYKCPLKLFGHIFKYNTGATSFVGCFNGNKTILFIPNEFFKYNPYTVSIDYMFDNCDNLHSVGADFFQHLPLLVTAKNVFNWGKSYMKWDQSVNFLTFSSPYVHRVSFGNHFGQLPNGEYVDMYDLYAVSCPTNSRTELRFLDNTSFIVNGLKVESVPATYKTYSRGANGSTVETIHNYNKPYVNGIEYWKFIDQRYNTAALTYPPYTPASYNVPIARRYIEGGGIFESILLWKGYCLHRGERTIDDNCCNEILEYKDKNSGRWILRTEPSYSYSSSSSSTREWDTAPYTAHGGYDPNSLYNSDLMIEYIENGGGYNDY